VSKLNTTEEKEEKLRKVEKGSPSKSTLTRLPQKRGCYVVILGEALEA